MAFRYGTVIFVLEAFPIRLY